MTGYLCFIAIWAGYFHIVVICRLMGVVKKEASAKNCRLSKKAYLETAISAKAPAAIREPGWRRLAPGGGYGLENGDGEARETSASVERRRRDEGGRDYSGK